MDSTCGWSRAKLKMKGVDVGYRSIKEAYYLAAIEKEQRVQAKRDIALINATLAQSKKGFEGAQKSLNKYLKELIPALKEGDEDFINKGTDLLDKFAGQEIILGGEKDAR